MKFKKWFLHIETYPTGGEEDYPGQNLNSNLPVQSKYATKNGSSKISLDAADKLKKPDKIFGFYPPQDLNKSQERRIK